MADEASIRASSSEGEPDPGSGFDDAGAELQEAQSEGGKLGSGECVRLGDCVSDGEDQPVRGGMQDQAHLVGERAAAAGTIRGELSLVQLDQVLGLAAGAIDRLVDMLGRSSLETGDDKADIEPLRCGLDPDLLVEKKLTLRLPSL